jgi:hypothetical protein
VGQIKGLLSWNIYTKGELDNSSKPDQIRGKGSLPEKTPLLKKKLLTLSPGKVTEGS